MASKKASRKGLSWETVEPGQHEVAHGLSGLGNIAARFQGAAPGQDKEFIRFWKGSGEHGEAAAGGHAYFGIVDVTLELHRDKNVVRRRLLEC